MKCKTCKSRCAWAGKEASEHGKCLVGYTPITNGDKIRSMSDYDLAEFLCAIMDCCGNDTCGTFCPMWKCCNDGPDNVEDWLKLPADKEEGE